MNMRRTAVAALAAAGAWAPAGAMAAYCESICNTTSTLADTACERELFQCVMEPYSYECGYTDYFGNYVSEWCSGEHEVCHTTGFEPLTCGQFGVFYVPPRPNQLNPACAELCTDYSTVAETPCDTPVAECTQVEYFYDCTQSSCFTDYFGNGGTPGCTEYSTVCQGVQEECHTTGYYDNTCGKFGVFFTPPPAVPASSYCPAAPEAGNAQGNENGGEQTASGKKFFGVDEKVRFTQSANDVGKGSLKFGADISLLARAGGYQNDFLKVSVANSIAAGQPDQVSAKVYLGGMQVWQDSAGRRTERAPDTGPLEAFLPPDPLGPTNKGKWEKGFQASSTFPVGPVNVTVRLRVSGKAAIAAKFDQIKEAGSDFPVGLYAGVGPQATIAGTAEAFVNALIAHAGVRASVNLITAGYYPGAKLYLHRPTQTVQTKHHYDRNARALDGSLTLFARVWVPFRWREYGVTWNWGPAWDTERHDDPPATCTQVTCGNGQCDPGVESYLSCPSDCGAPPPPPPPPPPACGDTICAPSEVGWCFDDCGQPPAPVCGDSVCDSSEWGVCPECPPGNPF